MRPGLALLAMAIGCGSPHTIPLMTYPVSPDAVRKACAMELSCLVPPPIASGGQCVTQFEEGLVTGFGILFGPSGSDLDRYVNCASAAPDCNGALTCASRDHGPSWCSAHGNLACDGDTLVGCVGGWGLELTDCTSLGMHCGSANGSASCTDGNTCHPQVDGARCMGNQLIDCNAGTALETSVDCAKYLGGTCLRTVSGSSSTTGCFPANSGCTDGGADHCSGNVVVSCGLGGALQVDCGQLASHCTVDASGKGACVPDATECGDTTPDSCAGSSIQMCVNGKLLVTSCSSIGFTSCVASTNGVACK
jgi:hypothetical protein